MTTLGIKWIKSVCGQSNRLFNHNSQIRWGHLRFVKPLKCDPKIDDLKAKVPEHFRHVYPEFLPNPAYKFRNTLAEKLEREDLLAHRSAIIIPEFYVGSVMAVELADQNAQGKTNRFVGICISRGKSGTRSYFILRNVIEGIGVEIKVDLYCPLIQHIEVLKLQKSIDDHLIYLRDALPGYSTYPLDMEAEPLPDGVEVPVITTKIQMKNPPWCRKWEKHELKGVEDFSHKVYLRNLIHYETHKKHWEKYDLMLDYRQSITEEEQAMIYNELSPEMGKLEKQRRPLRKTRLEKKY